MCARRDRAWTGAIDSQATGCAKHTRFVLFPGGLTTPYSPILGARKGAWKADKSAFLRAHARTSISFPGRMVRHAPGGAQSDAKLGGCVYVNKTFATDRDYQASG